MPSLWHRRRGSWSLAAGLVAGLFFLASSSLLAGAKSPSAPTRDNYAYATLLSEDLGAVPSFELGAKQYLLVIEAFRKAYLTDPDVSHKQESLLGIARIYQQMATSRFGESSHREESLRAYRLLLTEFPDTARRGEVVTSIRGLGGQPPPEPVKAPIEPRTERDGTRTTQGTTTDPALTPVALHGNAVRSGSMPVKAGRASSRDSRLASVRQVRYWSHPDYTRIIIELDRNVRHRSDRVEGPERIYFDFPGARLDTALKHAEVLEVNDPIVQRIRVGQNQRNVGRVVIDLTSRVPFSASWLSNPPRLAIELRGKPQELLAESNGPPAEPPPQPTFEEALRGESAPAATASTPGSTATTADVEPSSFGTGTLPPPVTSETIPPPVTSETIPPPWDGENQPPDTAGKLVATAELPPEQPRRVFERYEPRFVDETDTPPVRVAVESLNWRPVVDVSNGTGASGQVPSSLLRTDVTNLPPPASEAQALAKLTPPPEGAPVPLAVEIEPPKPAKATSRGKRNLIRALGLKLGRVVIDPGHGGRHTGSIGPTGLQEKVVVNDIAQRLGTLIEEQLGAEVIYTRTDDRFVALRRRTQIANGEKADLFISIHANAAKQRNVRGIETYYLNFTTDPWAMAVASRENAAANRSVHELQDLLSKIVLKETIDESREFAAKVQHSLHRGLAKDIKGLRNRGVRKAPLMVLIGAKMPAVLVEIGFISNPSDEKLLKSGTHRQKVAQHIYSGIAGYADTLSTFQVSQKKGKSTGDD